MSILGWAGFGFGCLLVVFGLPGCGGGGQGGPPSVRYGDSVCAECGMIISDERFATSTVIAGARGDEPLLFDDFNCQMIFEAKHDELVIVDRWCHDHATREWLAMGDAWFVKSDQLRTPMASHIAAFATQGQAEAFAESVAGDSMDFDTLWIQD